MTERKQNPDQEGPQQGSVPVPDPTERTNQQLDQKIQHVRELLAKDRENNQTRLDAVEKIIEVQQAIAARSPAIAVVDSNVKRLEDVTNERFIGVRQMFDDLIAKIDQASAMNAKAVDAAFSAQKEAVAEQNKSNALANAKSEASVTKQIDNIQTIMQQQYKSLDEKIEDTKARQSLSEGHKKGVETSYGIIIGLAGMAVTIGILAVAIIGLYLKNQ